MNIEPINAQCTVESVDKLGASTYRIKLRPTPRFAFRAGQYVRLEVSTAGAPPEHGYYSVASPPESPTVELIVGSSSAHLIRLRAGDRVALEGPFGDFALAHGPSRHAVLVSHGTGLAPLLSLLRSEAFARAAPLSTTLLTGYRSEVEVIDLKVFDRDLFKHARIAVTLSQPDPTRPGEKAWSGLRGRVTDHLKADTLQIDWAQTEFYLCGSPAMIDDAKALLGARKVPFSSIHVL